MKILVLIKEVPDMDKVKFDSQRGVVDRAKAPAEINPFDENALEIAVELKEKYPDIYVSVLTMGPKRAEKSLRMAYARGADECILLSDAGFGGSDTCATSKTLAAAIKKTGPYDLIICGEKTVDGDTAQVGAETAEYLGIPHCYYVGGIDYLKDGRITVLCEELWGRKQLRQMSLPALISVTKNIARPKLPTVKRRLASLNIQIQVLGLSELNGFLDAEETGFKGSPTKVSKVVVPEEKIRKSRLFREDPIVFQDAVKEVLASKGLIQR